MKTKVSKAVHNEEDDDVDSVTAAICCILIFLMSTSFRIIILASIVPYAFIVSSVTCLTSVRPGGSHCETTEDQKKCPALSRG